ncbi:nucleoside triphosphate pyrophosphohydrolase [Caproicibacter fermentans]|uniref:Nucleoside triphosphate pyrophosphohydrolase n=1 Tax=Caproicibacter fermentans TaxID=2576756 RepID=A0A7G8TBE0_9FIRM|nr:nucleoside triphosphate pyrophosphohydrolase [Caproicibacter fermentans]QNK40931.1 nucleoside triphosphate pyrophosphohydrolase [Caproicibacter fermentans]
MYFQLKETYTIGDLLDIMEILRSPGGCPWDREQTHQSIRNNLLEEAYEAAEAIDTDDKVLLQEELGDVLLQVVFHSRMEEENGGFSFSDVVDGIVKKLILRHPHVFGNGTAQNSEEVLLNWEAIKKEEKGRSTETQVLRGVSKALPALMRAQKVCRKAAKAEGKPQSLANALETLRDNAKQAALSAETGQKEEQMEKLGRLLLSIAELSGILELEAEQALSEACDRFIEKFEERENNPPTGID